MPNSLSAEERARLIMQSTVVTADDIIEQIHQAETAARQDHELAKHLDKTITVAADAVNRMNAAEVHMAALTGVLSELLRWHRNETPDTDEPPGEFIGNAYSALAATPEEALERARVVSQFIELTKLLVACRHLVLAPPSSGSGHKSISKWRDALTALDTLGKEETLHKPADK